jgi:acyl transferase domain-containing protein/acyl carrier protein
MKHNYHRTGLEIAVIGMACRFPDAESTSVFWNNLIQGVESIKELSNSELESAGVKPETYNRTDYVKTGGGIIREREYFDADFFGYTAAEAEVMDPQIRLSHECVWEALEDAGYNPLAFKQRIGVFLGAGSSGYWELLTGLSGKRERLGNYATWLLSGRDFLCTRISYKLNLRGPSVFLNTTCSTSLVAVDMACRSLLTGQCEMAMAGGVSLSAEPRKGYIYKEGMIDSADGHCRAFDSNASGAIGGEGVGVVVLKTLEDAFYDRDNIYAVIKGSAINNDGNLKIGYTAPSVTGQTAVIKAAINMAEVEPESVTYIEAHGTGTELGDPIEVEALSQAFGTEKRGYCALGSVKTNIGHLDTAAGIAGLIKTALSIKNRFIPPSLNFSQPNPKIDFEKSPFFVNTKLKAWKNEDYPLRAGVSSFGIGGTNAHVILEEAPEKREEQEGREYKLLLLSARSEAALARVSANLARYLEADNDISFDDVAYTLKVGRRTFAYRKMLICTSAKEAVAILTAQDSAQAETFFSGEERKRKVILIFPGQGWQYANMGRHLYERETVFGSEMDRCFDLLGQEVDYNLKEILYSGVAGEDMDQLITQTPVAQALLFIVEYSLAKLMMSWGITPQAMIGQGIGEYVAACIAGVFTLENALRMVAYRGRLIRKMTSGTMPTDPLLEEFQEFVGRIEMKSPKIPYISNPSGKWTTEAEALSAEYWVNHLQETERFDEGLATLLENEDALFVATGAGHTLNALVNQHPDRKPGQRVLSLLRPSHENLRDDCYLACQLGRLWLYGVEIDWEKYYINEERYRVPLPTYPFERKKYWLSPELDNYYDFIGRNDNQINDSVMGNLGLDYEPAGGVADGGSSDYESLKLQNKYIKIISDICRNHFGINEVDEANNLFDMGASSLDIVQIKSKIEDQINKHFPITLIYENPGIRSLSAYLAGVKARAKQVESGISGANPGTKRNKLAQRKKNINGIGE